MKTLVVALSLIMALPVLAQKTKNKAVWLKVDDKKILPTMVGKTFKSSDESLNAIITKNKVKSVEYVFSNSRNPELQKVVQFTCDCNAENLYIYFQYISVILTSIKTERMILAILGPFCIF